MNRPISSPIDALAPCWYYSISTTVRTILLVPPEGSPEREEWIDAQLKKLQRIFAARVAGFNAMETELHLLVQMDPAQVASWTDQEVTHRSLLLYPAHVHGMAAPSKRNQIEPQILNSDRLAIMRERLGSFSWFLKSFKEPLTRLVNRDEGAPGVVFNANRKARAFQDFETFLTIAQQMGIHPDRLNEFLPPQNPPPTSSSLSATAEASPSIPAPHLLRAPKPSSPTPFVRLWPQGEEGSPPTE